MKENTLSLPMPENVEKLQQILYTMYEEFTGKPAEVIDPFFVPRFSSGGMSSGYISPEFWFTRGFPLVVERYIESRRRNLIP